MTISSTKRKAGPYQGDDVTTTFAFDFKIFDSKDLCVTYADEAGAEQELTLLFDYTVSLNAEQETMPGGTVQLKTALPTGHTLTITSAMAYLQPTKITNHGGFYPAVLNDSLDRLTIFAQQLEEQVGRAVKVSVSSTISPDALVSSIQQSESAAKQSAQEAKGSKEEAQHSAQEAYNTAQSMVGAVEQIHGVFKEQATGLMPTYSATVCDELGGYPMGAVLLSRDGKTLWKNTQQANTTDPDSANAQAWVKLIDAEDLSRTMNGFQVGDFDLKPFRAAELPLGWYHANGDRYAVTSAVGQALLALPLNYKTDWHIVESDGMVNLPGLYHSDGRAYFQRAGQAPGVVQEDAIRNIYGFVSNIQSFNSTAPTNVGALVSEIDYTGYTGHTGSSYPAHHINIHFDSARIVPTAEENRPLNISFVPAIYLGV